MAGRERIRVKKRSRMKLSEVKGDLIIGKGATIIAEKDTIIVGGRIKNKGGFKCRGNLVARRLTSVKGSGIGKHGPVKIYGNLTCEQDIEVDVKLVVTGFLKTDETSAGMTIKVKKGTEADKISAGMKVVLKGETKADKVSAGSKVELHGKSIVGKVSAGRRINQYGYGEFDKTSSGAKTIVENCKIQNASAGLSFIAKGDVELGRVSAGFGVKLRGKSKVDKGSAGFSIKAKKAVSFGKLSAGFKTIFKQDSIGDSISAGFKIKSLGSLEANGNLSAGFKVKAATKLTGNVISAGRKIKAREIEAEEIKVSKRGKLIGKVRADQVILQERARAKNLIVNELEMYERSRARNVYANIIIIENNAVLRGKVEYTDRIEAEPKAKIRTKPKKVEKLSVE